MRLWHDELVLLHHLVDDEVGGVLSSAFDDKTEVEISYVKNGKYNNITEAVLTQELV